MKMDLAEIALSLGCTPQRLLRRDFYPGPGREPASGGLSAALPGPSPGPLPEQRSGQGPASFFADRCAELREKTPWGAVTPGGAGMDSRTIKPGELFFCLAGERVDGHDFALDAARAGACAVIAARDPFGGANCVEKGANQSAEPGETRLPPVFLVDDPLKALWRLAALHRDKTSARVIGVTGTAGKTSVKEVLARILALRGPTERNPMNLNNQIGLPLSMLNASADALFWVMEAGISEAGDMDELGRILRPDAALILNVGEAHLSGLGERGVAASKAVLLDYIQPGGLALVSADYPDLLAEAEKRANDLADKGVALVHFSLSREQVFSRAEYLGQGPDLAGRYRAVVDGRELFVRTCFQNDFGSENVAAIAAVAVRMGLSDEEIIRGFSCAELPGQRFNCRRHGDVILVDDSYNANPLSSARMIRACRAMADDSGLPLYLVMGEMLELGDRAAAAHEELGLAMAAALPATVFWKGGQARTVLRGLQRGGYGKSFYPVSGGQDFSLLLEELDPQCGLFLFKGSRRNNLERLADILRERMAPSGEGDAV